MPSSNLLRHLFSITAIGVSAAVLFILVQPLFGMETITSRHSQAYISQGGYSDIAAITLSWGLHTLVSIVYATASIAIYTLNSSKWVSLGQVLLLGWVSTLIATPANVIAIKVITLGYFPDFSTVPPLNGDVGPKLWLHIVFFVLVLAMAYALDYIKRDTRLSYRRRA